MAENRSYLSVTEAQPPFFVGVDLGGQSIKVGVVDDQGRPLGPAQAVPTEIPAGAEAACARMGQAVHDVLAKALVPLDAVARVGLGSPGTMDIPAGKLLNPVNLKGWDNFPLRDRLTAHCGLKVTFENDANAAAYGEFWVGSGQRFHSMVLFTLGTGIGCGIVIGDLVIQGENSHGAECGHILIDSAPNARICGCGQPGHLEAYASATAVVKRTQEALATRVDSSLAKRLAGGCGLSPKLVAQEAEHGDALALEIVLETARYLGLGVVTLMHTIDPNGVLLGGAMTFGGKGSPLGQRFLDEVKAEVRRRAFPLLAERTVIDFAALGNNAGYIGAAGVARLDYLRSISV